MLCYIDYRKVEKPLPWKDALVEIGFGRGDFTVRLAKENPDKKVLGFELSAISVEKLIRRARREGLRNVYCSRIDAYWGLYLMLKDSSVERLYMNYPDPWFKKRHHKRRLTRKENLYVYAKKLKMGGTILIRTDHLPFAEFTLEEARNLGAFEHKLRRIEVGEPLTKYEEKWLSIGKELFELSLRKVREPEPMKIREIKEVKELYPVKVEGREPYLKALEGKEIKLDEGVYLKFFGHYERKGAYLIEVLLSEQGFTQRFFVLVREKGEGSYIVDVSPFSEVLKTENIQRAVRFVSEEGFRPLSR